MSIQTYVLSRESATVEIYGTISAIHIHNDSRLAPGCLRFLHINDAENPSTHVALLAPHNAVVNYVFPHPITGIFRLTYADNPTKGSEATLSGLIYCTVNGKW